MPALLPLLDTPRTVAPLRTVVLHPFALLHPFAQSCSRVGRSCPHLIHADETTGMNELMEGYASSPEKVSGDMEGYASSPEKVSGDGEPESGGT